jgi:LmbE family N-acetylglucosaminyl deacetylase
MAEMGLPSPFGEWKRPEDVPMGAADEQITTIVDVRQQLATKLAALRAHDSQLDRSSFFLNLPPELEVEAFGRESFVRLRSDVAAPDREDDLFAGLR